MTLTELVPMLQNIGFDCTVTPARRGPITLAEFSYDEIEKGYWFRFRWDDITLGVAPSALPKDVWDAIKEDASAGNSDTFIFGLSRDVGYTEDSTPAEIASGIMEEIERFTARMEARSRLVTPWIVE